MAAYGFFLALCLLALSDWQLSAANYNQY